MDEKYDNKLCIKMKKDFCFIRAEENMESKVNLVNIGLAQICLLDRSKKHFFII